MKTKFRIGGNGFPWWVDFLNGGENSRYQSPFHEGYCYKCIYDYWCAAPALQHMGIRSIPEEPQGRQKSGRGQWTSN